MIPKQKIIILLIIVLTSMNLSGQDLKKHKWKNRVVLILSKTIGNPDFHDQSELFDPQTKGFKARKLIIYEILPDISRLKNKKSQPWYGHKNLFKAYNKENAEFKVVLIGLDGGVKFETKDVLPTSDLFDIIDAMPMRRAELKNN